VAYRYLFEQLVRRELRQKYKGSALGVAWYLINPLVLMGAYYLMFGLIFKLDTIEDYPLFLMVGLVVWIFFSQSVLSAAPSRRSSPRCCCRGSSCRRSSSRRTTSRTARPRVLRSNG
jgi:ABC-type polysaccharide/polyol phosphate export permease